MQHRLLVLTLLLSFPLFSANYHTWSTSKIYIERQHRVMKYMSEKKKIVPDIKTLTRCELEMKKLDEELMRRTKYYKISA